MIREAGTQVSPVTMSHLSLRPAAPPCLPLDIKVSLKEDRRLLLWGFCFGLLGFGVLDEGRFFDVEGFGREKDCWREKNC
jgi:hypothetical protein